MAARTLENERDRRMTIMLTPFMSCSAKMPVYALFIAAFFPKYKGLVVFGLYALGLVVAILCAMILKRTVLKGRSRPFVMELPPYRLPTVKTLWMHLYERVKDFAVRAGTILLGASIVIWFLRSFSFAGGFHMLTADQAGDSLLASAGKLIAPLFIPLGFGFWQASVALVAGLVAKEAVVGTLSILYNNATDAACTPRCRVFSPRRRRSPSWYSCCCICPAWRRFPPYAREMNSWKWAVGTVAFQTGVAWVVSFVVYQFTQLAVNLAGLF